MTKEQENAYYEKFPAIIQSKIANGEFEFPCGIQFQYNPILAYRAIIRDKDDYTPVNIEDMRSYFEKNQVPRGVDAYKNDPKYYAVSLFTSSEKLKQCLHFPRPRKKIAQGYVYMEGGPQYTENNGHVNWWLYEDVSFENFVIKEGEENE